MKHVEELLADIKSIGYYLASRKDIDANIELYAEIKEEKKELTSDITDFKLSDLQDRLDILHKYISELSESSVTPPVQKIKICIASSNSLKEEREALERFLFQKNDELVEQGIYLYYNVWEKQSTRFNNTYKQVDFNKALVYESDIFICLISDDVGKFTKEEFDEAKRKFDANEKPLVFYVYFRKYDAEEKAKVDETDGWVRRLELKKHIHNELQQYVGEFANKDQLIRKIEQGLVEDIQIVKEKISSSISNRNVL